MSELLMMARIALFLQRFEDRVARATQRYAATAVLGVKFGYNLERDYVWGRCDFTGVDGREYHSLVREKHEEEYVLMTDRIHA